MSAGYGRRKINITSAAAPVARVGCFFALAITLAAPAHAKPYRQPSFNLFGISGLIDMPTAELQPDGQVSFTSSYFDGFLRNTLTFQALPRFETTFRYSILDEYFDDGRSLYDRSFDIKFRFLDEGKFHPAMALGLQDFLGTGIYSGEYLVATKHATPDITITGGVGWGRFAGRNTIDNPFTLFSKRFESRAGANDTGQVKFGDFFRGRNIGVFGGVAWDTPIDGLRVKAEYSSDAYVRDLAERDSTTYPSQLNFGVEYRPYGGVELGAYYLYGQNIGARLTMTGNPYEPIYPPDIGNAPPPVKPRKRDEERIQDEFGEIVDLTGEAQARVALDPALTVELEQLVDGPRWARAESGDCDRDTALAIDAEFGVVDGVTFVDRYGRPICSVILRQAGRDHIVRQSRPIAGYNQAWHGIPEVRAKILAELQAALANEEITVHAIRLDPTRIAIDIENARYRAMAQAIGRTARILTRELPPSIEVFEITPVVASLPTTTITLRRALLEEQVEHPDATQRSWLTAGINDAAVPRDGGPEVIDGLFPRYRWGINPYTRIGLFDPDSPLRIDLRLGASGSVEVIPGLSITGAVSQSLYSTLDDISRVSTSVLPHVRSDTALYAKEGAQAIDRLTADYVFKLDDDIFARTSIGYFEEMFAGVSGEVLWKPADQNWGLGAEINYAVQRDYDQMLGLKDYDVFTGHASFYWDTGFYGLEAQVDAGRYLAGDLGATFSLSRRFSNGWEIGGFFTLTDVSFDDFGEGSFDKGIKLTIPLNWALPYEGTSEYTNTIRPVTRDGGARLNIANRLYPMVRDLDKGGLHENWGSFWR